MALYIRDDAVDALAVELQQLTHAPTKTEAVRQALQTALDHKRSEIPLLEKLRQIRADAAAAGLVPNPKFDQKAFFDEMWDDD